MINPDYISYRKEILDYELERCSIDIEKEIKEEFSYKLSQFISNKYPVNKFKHPKYGSNVYFTDLIIFKKEDFNMFLEEYKCQILSGVIK